MAEQRQSRLHQQFQALLRELIGQGALTEAASRNLPLPTEAGEIVPRLWEAGIDDVKLARALARLFKRAQYDGVVRDRDSLVRSSQDRCPWLIVDRVQEVVNISDDKIQNPPTGSSSEKERKSISAISSRAVGKARGRQLNISR